MISLVFVPGPGLTSCRGGGAAGGVQQHRGGLQLPAGTPSHRTDRPRLCGRQEMEREQSRVSGDSQWSDCRNIFRLGVSVQQPQHFPRPPPRLPVAISRHYSNSQFRYSVFLFVPRSSKPRNSVPIFIKVFVVFVPRLWSDSILAKYKRYPGGFVVLAHNPCGFV